MSDGLMTRKQAAAWLGVSLNTLDRLPIPRVLLAPRVVRYRRADLAAYADAKLEKVA